MSKCHLAGRTVPVGQFWTCMIESQVLKLESGKKDTSAENLRQTVIKILSNTIGKKKTCSLSRPQRTALK